MNLSAFGAASFLIVAYGNVAAEGQLFSIVEAHNYLQGTAIVMISDGETKDSCLISFKATRSALKSRPGFVIDREECVDVLPHDLADAYALKPVDRAFVVGYENMLGARLFGLRPQKQRFIFYGLYEGSPRSVCYQLAAQFRQYDSDVQCVPPAN
jgi:hypothetical protein